MKKCAGRPVRSYAEWSGVLSLCSCLAIVGMRYWNCINVFYESEVEDFRKADPESSFQIEIYEFHDSRLERLSLELHPGLPRRAPSFSDVTGTAASHDIGPVIYPALHLGDHVVNSQIAGRKLSAAVLAEVGVPDQNVFPRERHLSLVNLTDELDEPDYRGNSEGSRHRPDRFFRFLDDFDLAVEEENHGALPRNQPHEFIAGVQDYDGLHC